MSTMVFKLYDLLKSKLGTSEAQAVVEFIHIEINSGLEKETKTLATKEVVKDEINRLELKIEQTKHETLKWLFGFWITLVLLILANWFLKK